MNLFLNILLLLVGFVALIKGADFFVDGSASIARTLKVPGVIIGLTIVAMGTSAPELAVSASAAFNKSNNPPHSHRQGHNQARLSAVYRGHCRGARRGGDQYLYGHVQPV